MSDIEKYLRPQHFPHILCPGCGHGIVMGALVRAIDKLKLDQDRTVIVSGIGCSSRIPGYLNFDTLHTTHGRALAFATGIKLANPELNVIVLMGDGDATAIGGNHFIHACRRNVDLTAIVLNNNIYGMTSGQYSPLTPTGSYATTAPYGTVDRQFDLCNLAQAAGATYVARGTIYNTALLENVIRHAIAHKGFSVVDAVSACPTYFGRKNKQGGPVDMLRLQKENSVSIEQAKTMSPEDLKGKIVVGEFYEGNEPEYVETYLALIDRVRGEATTK
jgi:2-oxoglutarate ferredoxin oxidoreductase subunit beta